MKKLLLFSVFALVFLGCSSDSPNKSNKYLTDDDFKIQIISWESWGDITDDGITQNVLIEKGGGEILVFTKGSGALKTGDNVIDFADSSKDGFLIFDNYGGSTPKIMNFTTANKITVDYDSRKDIQRVSYEVSTTTAYY